jgi:hypothetical protein
MGTLEKEIERGITYMPDNDPDTIAATLKRVISDCSWGRTAAKDVHEKYGPGAVSQSLLMFINQVLSKSAKDNIGIENVGPLARYRPDGGNY